MGEGSGIVSAEVQDLSLAWETPYASNVPPPKKMEKKKENSLGKFWVVVGMNEMG